MIRTLLFLRAWHAEMRLWRTGLLKLIGKAPGVTDDNMHNAHMFVLRCWGDFVRGEIRTHD